MDIDERGAYAEVEAASDQYEAALLSNDTDTLDALFWHDARAVRINPKAEFLGIDNIRKSRVDRPLAELARDYLSRQITCFGTHSAVVNIVFLRKLDSRVGRQSQTWVRIDRSWRIVSAHISFRES